MKMNKADKPTFIALAAVIAGIAIMVPLSFSSNDLAYEISWWIIAIIVLATFVRIWFYKK